MESYGKGHSVLPWRQCCLLGELSLLHRSLRFSAHHMGLAPERFICPTWFSPHLLEGHLSIFHPNSFTVLVSALPLLLPQKTWFWLGRLLFQVAVRTRSSRVPSHSWEVDSRVFLQTGTCWISFRHSHLQDHCECSGPMASACSFPTRHC